MRADRFTARKSHAELARAVAISQAQARVLELAVRDRRLAESLDAIAATVEELSTSGVLTSILLADEDGRHLRHGASPSLPAAYNAAIDGIAVGPIAGSCGTAAYRRAPVYVSDIASDPLWTSFRDLALSHGLQACWSVPILSGDTLLGTFAMYYRQPRDPSPEDLELTDFIVRSAALVIDRKRAEERLRFNESRLRGVLDGMAEGFSLVAPDFTVLDINQEALRLDGRPREALVGRTQWELYPGSEDSALGRLFKTAMADRTTATTEHLHHWPDGRRAWIETRAYPVEQGLALFYRDVSGRHAADAALRASEARLTLSEESLRLATEAAEVGTWDLDLVRNELTWPARTKAMFGISPDTPCSMADFEAGLHPEDRAATLAAFAAATDPAIRSTYDVEYRTIGKEDGQVRWVAAKGKGLFDRRGRCVRAIGTAIDITARKRLEVRRAALIELADRIRDTTDPSLLGLAAAGILGRTLGVTRAGFGLIDPASGIITLGQDWHPPGQASIAGVLPVHEYGTAARELTAGRTVAVSDLGSDAGLASTAAALTAAGVRAFMIMPLPEQDSPVALLFLAHGRAREWPDDELDFIGDVGRRTRTAIARLTAEEALRASQGQLEALTNSVDQMIWSADAQGQCDYFNQRWYDFTGVPRGATDGDGWSRLVHPEDRAGVLEQWQRCLADGHALRAEYRLCHSSGQYRWVLARAQPVRDADRITRWYGTCTEIEDMVAAREVLARSREELEALVGARTAERNRLWRVTSLLVAVTGSHAIIREVNPAWHALLGWSEAELVGRSYIDFVHPEDIERTLAWTRLEAGQAHGELQNRYRCKDGQYRWIAWSMTASDGVIHCIGRDITTQKTQEAALAAAEDALRQSQKMEAVGQLTGGLAHDFNNLLAGISGSLERIALRMAQGRPAEIEHYVSAAQGAARRAAALTHRLLAFSRRQTLDPKCTDVNRLVAGMEDLIRRTVGPAIALDVVGAPSLWRALVDPPQLESALLNLCINARDAMPKGGRITIETANRTLDRATARKHGMPEGQYLSISVSDTGYGMSPDVLAKAFEPFFTTKPIGAGTGLGLSMVYGFAKQSGGHVRILSEVGRGSTVCIYLPRHEGEGEAEGQADLPEGPGTSGSGETVLVVDDEPTVRMLVIEVLEDLGYTAIEAADSATGLAILQSPARIDLLVSDVGLPGGMNGRQMADAGRQTRPGLKVLFMTGYAENAAIGNGVLGPGMAVLTKPFTLDTLAGRISEMIASR